MRHCQACVTYKVHGGTSVEFSNSGTAAIDDARKRLVPVSVQGLVMRMWAAQFLCRSRQAHRKRFPSGSQSPGTPSADNARVWRGPNAEEPNRASGSTTPSAVFASSSMRVPSLTESTVLKPLQSTAATSTFSSRGKLSGVLDSEKEDQSSFDWQIVRTA